VTLEKKVAEIAPAKGKLGVLLVGLGAVSTTFIAGVEAVKRGLAEPIGSLTQMGTIRLGKRTENRVPLIKEFVPLADLEDLVFGAWDIFPDSAYEAAMTAGVLEKELLAQLKPQLQKIRPMKAVFDQSYVKRLNGTNVKEGADKMELAEQLVEEIAEFKRRNRCSRLVMVWAASTEVFMKPHAVHKSLKSFEQAMHDNHKAIAPSMIYAYAALKSGVPFANGAPNLTVDTPALMELAAQRGAPVCGKDFKTGQTLMKTVIGPALKARMLGVNGWFSTNILGNRDGEVLDDPESFRSKEITKRGVLDEIFDAEANPELYGELFHKVRIEYYPPRGDAKEGWDNIDLFGWMGRPMQMKIDFLCRDSILAAPIVLDLALLLDLAQRGGCIGTQDWLSFYFKSPMTDPGRTPEHDLFVQSMKLKNRLRSLMGHEPSCPPGRESYD
jgi:myo-inositol-1-phosphate synthase